ncbi:M14 family zinc carboxypeptidase [Halomicrobium salinisoli]|uniref:M14 family zinc carboxypeptidase n=1 Tax=Halomicrobium salinisoli TaxID=2878391 RepID=UPI001CF076A4|nr:M14 family zinc carboxypeptidase [Halomicrobium salinisoli]
MAETTIETPTGDVVLSTAHPGGNADVVGHDGHTIVLEPEQRDSEKQWFYWNFEVRSRSDVTLDFRFHGCEPLGPWGPATTTGNDSWEWLGTEAATDRSQFSYSFAEGEVRRFAFSLPYQLRHLDRFLNERAQWTSLSRTSIGTSDGGRSVPCLSAGARGETRNIVLACRHHACETTASYVLEGIVDGLLTEGSDLLSTRRLHVFPLVDVDGVERGDQGKHRIPHDHNRDYATSNALLDSIPSLYASTEAIRNYLDRIDGQFEFSLDLHCPWMYGERNDRPFFVDDPDDVSPSVAALGQTLEKVTESRGSDGIRFDATPGTGIENFHSGEPAAPTFSQHLSDRGAISTTLEVPYFGVDGNEITSDSCRRFGVDISRAVIRFLTEGTG